jgi:hypothetical protein
MVLHLDTQLKLLQTNLFKIHVPKTGLVPKARNHVGWIRNSEDFGLSYKGFIPNLNDFISLRVPHGSKTFFFSSFQS